MKKITFICFVSLLFLNSLVFSQVKIVKVWPDKIPGALDNSSVKEKIVVIEKGAERVLNVTDPTLSVYFPSEVKANGTAVIICPGGGYGRLAMSQEGNDVAAWLNRSGVTAIVLKYRLPDDAIMSNKSIGPLQDIQQAVRIVRKNSGEWNIDPTRIGVMGFSAGGHLASTIATHFDNKVYDAESRSARPDFSILIYPVISMNQEITHKGSRKNLLGDDPTQTLIDEFSNELKVTPSTPPTFIVHAADDTSVPVQNSINYFLALKRNQIRAELHIYEKGGHGFGLAARGGTVSNWPDACLKWLSANGFLK